MALPLTTEFVVLESWINTGSGNLVEIQKAVDSALQGEILESSPVSENLFHIHTLTIQIGIPPPNPVHQYPTGPRENPEHRIYTDIRNKLIVGTEACVPITLSYPAENLMRMPADKKKSYEIADTRANIFLPSSHHLRPLLTLHRIPITTGSEWLWTSKLWDTRNWVQAAMALDPNQLPTRKGGNYRDKKTRVHLHTGLQISWTPEDDSSTILGPNLQLLVTINAYLNMSTIFDPQPEIGSELMSIILYSLMPSPATKENDSIGESRGTSLKTFYNSLRPAPDFALDFDARRLQPPEMVSRLLPFQMRTLALLLQRERAPIAGDSQTIQPEGFWVPVNFGKFGLMAFACAGGRLLPLGTDRKGKSKDTLEENWDERLSQLPHFIDLSSVRGTMLCEEMGLGKTVEAIALMLLHRHPLSTPRAIITDPQARARHSLDIDLYKGPQGLDIPQIESWIMSEHAAFNNAESWDNQSQLLVSEVATTLIVTPSSLLKQWVTEMATHAPSLRVCVYPGWKALRQQIERKHPVKEREKREAQRGKRQAKEFRNQTRVKYIKADDGDRIKIELEDESEVDVEPEENVTESAESLLEMTQLTFLEYVRAHDVVIATYQNLTDDLKVALPAPQRSRRSTATYRLDERPRSPLVMVEWWRVIMDEVQLQSDQSAAANMVSLIPRKCSLAVSGTPARSDVKDLMGSLRFLRVPGIDVKMWHRLQQSPLRLAFEGLFAALAVRTTKAQVASEFSLPHQTRYIVPIDLSDIEMTYYLDTLARQRERLALPEYGRPTTEYLQYISSSSFRSSLQHLRQICTHIQVGALQHVGNRFERGDRLHLGRQLMTMEQALVKMRTDHEQEFVVQTRMLMRAMVRKAQLSLLNDMDDLRHLTALMLLERVRDMGLKLLGPARERLRDLVGDHDEIDDVDPENEVTQAEKERQLLIKNQRQLVRETLIVLHQSWFFEGDVRHVRKEEDKEVVAYQTAEELRKEILSRPLKTANAFVVQMTRALERTSAVSSFGDFKTNMPRLRSGILSADVIQQSNDLISILNDNAALVFAWRIKVVSLLKLPLEAEDEKLPAVGKGQDVENPDEEYYAEALKAQGDVEAYLTAYAAAIADRKEMLLEERSALAVHDARMTKKRTTKAAIEAAMDEELPDPDSVDELTFKLMQERQAFRDRRKEMDCLRPLKAMLIDLSAIVHGGYRSEEVAIATGASSFLRTFINEQTEMVDKLNKELDLFRSMFNRRVIYFASLQEISDSVAVPAFKDLHKEIASASQQIIEYEVIVARMTVRGRYLRYLGASDQPRDVHSECSICFGTSDDKFAMLLKCGHAFCESCFREFRKSAYIGKKCATCKTPIIDREVTRIKITSTSTEPDSLPASQGETGIKDTPEEDENEEENEEDERDKRAADLAKLKMIPEEAQRSVMSMDMMGEYGSKINFLVKHLLFYRLTKPDVRHVVFSNWADSLQIVERALDANRIKFVSFEKNTKTHDVVEEFKRDLTISVFLLHAERESAGLTLTSCGVVHLLEPVLRHSFELQAIGRVDRLGQKKETTVYCYATMDTVEARILSQGVRNGTSIYLADEEGGEKVVASMSNVASAAHKGGDLSGGSDADLFKLFL